MLFQQLIVSLLIHEALAYLGSLGPTDWAKAKATALAKVQRLVHPAWLATDAGAVVYKVIDALAMICADTSDTAAVLKDLAAKDYAGAEAAALAELVKAVPEVGAIFGFKRVQAAAPSDELPAA